MVFWHIWKLLCLELSCSNLQLKVQSASSKPCVRLLPWPTEVCQESVLTGREPADLTGFLGFFFNAKALEEPFSVCILQPNFNSHISRSHFTLFSSVCVEMELGQSCPSAGRDLCPHCSWISPGSQHRLSSSLAPVPCLKASQKISWG